MFEFGLDIVMRSSLEKFIEQVGYFYFNFFEIVCFYENKVEIYDGDFLDEIIIKQCYVGREDF